MRKKAALTFSLILLVSAGSAAVIPPNLTIDLNIDLFGDEQNQKQEEKKNTTYGERVGGQAVHTETEPNEPAVQRNSQEYGITEKDTNEKNDFGEMVVAFLYDVFGEKGGPDTSQPNSVT
ncbi:MAG: hypothetical protein ABEJ36_03560 [Candidatus Nanosalina sp.]